MAVLGCQVQSSNKTRNVVSLSLQHKLSTYAIAGGAAGVSALALSQAANAKVVYTGAHQFIGQNQSFGIDLNHDGAVDFTIQNIFKKSASSSYRAARIVVKPNSGGEVIYDNFRSAAAALSKGAVIGPRGPFHPAQSEIMADRFRIPSAGTYSFGYWLGASNHYLGFRFKIDGQVHYGWARLTTGYEAPFKPAAHLTGYAYETEPETPIFAGDVSGAAEANAVGESGGAKEILLDETSSRMLGVLALGASGMSIWKRDSQLKAWQ
jgi:hypothetical protein